jgi:superfamily II DNA/RNA helicase
MLDIGFRDDIRKILKSVNDGLDRRNRVREVYGIKIQPDYADAGDEQDVPELPDDELQTMFVSATLSPEIEKLARTFMRNDDVEKLVATGADESPTVELVEQYHIPVSGYDKGDLILALLEDEKPELSIVFTRTKRGAEKLTKKLTAKGIDVQEIHGNLNQSKREKVMKGFRDRKFDVLVATDLASRGIDVRGVSHIINYDVPEDPEAYVHRIGRTARMGMEGKAYTFVTPDQGQELTRIEMLINMEIPRGTINGFAGGTNEVKRLSEDELKAADAEKNGEVEDVAPEPKGPPRRRRSVGKAPLRGRR